MSPVIRFSNVSKRYNLGLTRTSLPSLFSQWIKKLSTLEPRADHGRKYHMALNNVSFELERGDSLALIGPNGAGKSTILKLLARITKPTVGEIDIRGKLSALIELGAGFHPDLTGRENIFLNGTILGLSFQEIEKRFDEIVDFSELESFIDTPVKRYSSGMTVRLGFAVASCIEPDILLVDEVLAVGDASFRQKCIDRIQLLLQNGTSLIFVSHDMGLVKSVCQQALYIEKGVIQYQGEVGSVIDHYNRVLDKKRVQALRGESAAGEEGGPAIEITRLEVVDENGAPIEQTTGDKPAEFRIHYVAFKDIGRANALVRIYRSDGLSCFIVRTAVDGHPVQIEKGGGIISVTLAPLQLFGGTYYATAWLMDAGDSLGLSRATSDWFSVVNITPGRDAHEGVYEPHRKWRHLPRPENPLRPNTPSQPADEIL